MKFPTVFSSLCKGALALSLLGAAASVAAAPCDTFYPSGFSLSPNPITTPAPSLALPARGATVTEPTQRTCLVRATDHVADNVSGFAVNDYSRREPFNANNSRYIVNSGNGYWYLYDANTLQKLSRLNGLSGDAEPQWHPTDPNTLYYVPGNGGTKLYALNVATNTSTVVADFAGKLPWSKAAHVWTKSEGSPSRDGRYWGFQVEDANFKILGYVVWDLQNNRLVGSKAMTTRPDHVSMSPSGRWFVASGSDGTYAWSTDFKTKKQLHKATEHSDIAVGADGHDVYVSIDYQSGNGSVFMVDIDTGVRTDLFPTYINGSYTALHVSGKAYAKPGWVLVSTYAGSASRDGSRPWYLDQIFALELKAQPRIYPIAFHRSKSNGYWSEPHAAVSRDFSRILFSSNWGGSSDAALDAYLIGLPATALGGSGTTTPPPPANVAPRASFTTSTSTLSANFTDTSTDSDGTIAARRWNFGDGSSATGATASHSYAAAGSYTVTLTVTDDAGATATTTQTVTVTAPPTTNKLPVADFSLSSNELTVSFTDASSDSDGSIVGRRWNFGDNIQSTATSPTHTYAAAGSYTVTLTVTDNAGGSHSTSKPVTLTTTVTPPPPPVTTITGPCANFYAPDFSLAEGRLALSIPTAPKPAKGAVTREATFGTCLVRATDHTADGVTSFARNDYSRRQPFNADSSRFIVDTGNGAWYLYDANTLQKLVQLNGLSGDAEPQWHPTDPNTLYYLPTNGGMKLYALNVATNTSTVAADFTGKLPWSNAAHVWTKSEGSPSRDARYWGFQVEDANFKILGFVVWDLQNNRLVGSKNVTVRPDHISMSPSGRWIVSSGFEGVFAYSADFSVVKQLHTTTEHSDIAIGKDGHDVFVSIDYGSNDGTVFMVDIDTGVRTNLFPTYVNGAATAMHFSGKAYDKPGWVLIGAYAGSPSRDGSIPWFEEKVFALELSPSPKVYEIAAHRSGRNGYWTEPHAAPNRDFTRLLFNSNWSSGSDTDVDAYLIQLPAGVVN